MKRNILLGLSLLLLGACQLETPPESDLTYTGFWNKEEAAKSVHSGVYSSFRAYGYTMWLMGELRSDIWGGKGIENAHNQDLFTMISILPKWHLITGEVGILCCIILMTLLKMRLRLLSVMKMKRRIC